MNKQLYVATNAEGVEQTASGAVLWGLPRPGGDRILPGEVTAAPEGGELVLYRPAALLEALDERIFVAEPVGETDDRVDTAGARAARLTSETAWGVETAARFALDCAAHVLGAAASTALPDGSTLGDVVAEARGDPRPHEPGGRGTARPAGATRGAAPASPARRRARRCHPGEAEREPRERPRRPRRPRLDDDRGVLRGGARRPRGPAAPRDAALTSAHARTRSTSTPPTRRARGAPPSRHRGDRSFSGPSTARPTSPPGPPPVTRRCGPANQRPATGIRRPSAPFRLIVSNGSFWAARHSAAPLCAGDGGVSGRGRGGAPRD